MDKTNNYKYIIREALKNYDDILLNNSIMYYKFKFCIPEEEHSDNSATIKFYLPDDNNKKVLYKSFNYEFVGYSSNNNTLWTWSWGIPEYPRNLINVSRNIFNWAWDTNNIDNYIKKILISSSQMIEHFIQNEIFISLSLYLSHYKFIYNIITSENAREYSNIFILN